jgi:hypothetical protein
LPKGGKRAGAPDDRRGRRGRCQLRSAALFDPDAPPTAPDESPASRSAGRRSGRVELAVEILARLEPAFEAMLVLTGKVENDHREPGRKLCSGKGWYPEPGSNRHSRKAEDFKSLCLPIPPSGQMRHYTCPEMKERESALRTFPFGYLEREKSLELSTYTLARYRSTN